jgi:hypothetical protein
VVNGGHNDLVVGLAILAGTLLVVDRRAVAAGAVLATAVLVKLVVALALAALAVWAWRRYGRPFALRMVATAGALVVAAYAAWGPHSLDPVLAARAHTSRGNVFTLPAQLFSSVVNHESTLALLLMAAVTLVLLATIPRDAAPASVAGAALLVFMFGAAYVLPWYVAWALPVFGLLWRSRLALVAALHAGLLALAYTGQQHLHLMTLYLHFVLPAALAVGLVYLVITSTRRSLHPAAPTAPMNAAVVA